MLPYGYGLAGPDDFILVRDDIEFDISQLKKFTMQDMVNNQFVCDFQVVDRRWTYFFEGYFQSFYDDHPNKDKFTRFTIGIKDKKFKKVKNKRKPE